MDGFSYRESRWSHSSGYAKKQIVAVYAHKNGDSYENTPKYKKGFGVHHDRHAGEPIIKQSVFLTNWEYTARAEEKFTKGPSTCGWR